MKPSQRSATSSSERTTGLIAMLGGSVRANGSSARPAPRVRLGLVALIAIVAACLIPAPALAATAHELKSSFGPDCTSATHFGGSGSFEGAGTIAVDQQTHDVYVADANSQGMGVSRCKANGEPDDFTAGPGAGSNRIPGFSFFTTQGFSQIAVNSTSHVFYVADGEHGAIKAFAQDGSPAAFTAGPSAGSSEITSFGGAGFGEVGGVAVDGNGDVYVSNYTAGAVDVYSSSGEELTSFATVEPANLAVDSEGAVYVSGFEAGIAGVRKFTPSAFPVTAGSSYSEAGSPVDPEPAYAIAVDPASGDLYVVEHIDLNDSRVSQFSKTGEAIGVFAKPGEPGALSYAEGIAIDGASGDVYLSDLNGEHQVEIFAPPPAVAPEVVSTAASEVTSSSANVSAVIDPEHFDTRYRFQYVTEAQFQASGFAGAGETSEVDLGSAGEPQVAHGFISGLTPDTAYRLRVVAENEAGEATSAEVVAFSTFAMFAPGLPDGRTYELVSPAQKAGEVLPPDPNDFYPSDGSCRECLPGVDDGQSMPMQSSPDGDTIAYSGQPFGPGLASGANEYLARRGVGAWKTQPLSSPLFGASEAQGYVAFSSDLTRSVIYQISPALSPEAPTREGKSFANLYLREEGVPLRPLMTVVPQHRSPREPGGPNAFHIVFAGANSGTESASAFSHILFEANDALTEAVPGVAPEAPEVGAGESDLYEWMGGRLRLVNVLPGNGTGAPEAVIGSGTLLGSAFESANIDHAISADGSRIFWSDGATGQVYVRVDGKTTFEIPGPGRCKESLERQERVCFLTASADGSQVLLSNGEIYKLNGDESAYVPSADLTQGLGGFSGILGAGEDLSHIYFVDTKVLPGLKANADEEVAVDGADNLYAWHEGTVTFLGRLLGSDNDVGFGQRYGDWKASPSSRLAQVSPDGTLLAFTSQAELTGYDSLPSGGGICDEQEHACREVFEYDASSGRLTCASCNPTGIKPLGPSTLSLINSERETTPLSQPQDLSTGGRLFFDSQDALSPRDTNGHIQDVYEWEPDGLGSCTRGGGCVFLISSGSGPEDSSFINATPDGDDVFIATRQQLVAQDKNNQIDLYDARVGGGLAEGEAAPCGGEACRGPLSGTSPSPAPGSAVFSGLGNLTIANAPEKAPVLPRALTRAQKLANALRACANKPKKHRRACRMQARKRYGPTGPKTKTKPKAHKGGK